MRAHAHARAFGAATVAVAIVACGTSANHNFGESGNPSGAASGSTASGAGDNVFAGDAAPPVLSLPQGTPSDASLGDSFVGCAMDTQRGKELPLDLYIMLDTSGSMNDLVGPQRSKWNAVSAAITAFVNDPGSAGIGVGVQYFPKTAAGFPASCTKHAQCGAGGACLLSICADGSGQITPCISDLDCLPFACLPMGECQYDHNVICPPGVACGNDMNGFALGVCQTVTTSVCLGSDDCVAADYATPAVAIAPLPGVAPAIIAFLGSHEPNGATPTPAALQGAIDGAKAYAMSHAGHTVVVVLATDGAPNEIPNPANGICAGAPQATIDTEVGRIAAAGLKGPPSIKTFGIGVFTPSDAPTGTVALNQIAAAGGTTAPFIIDVSGTASNLEQKFVAALNMIRGTALPCQYQIPVPAMGIPNYLKLNVHYTAGSGADLIVPYVENSGGCDAKLGGWYYDVDPAEGGTPTTINVCPTTCSTLKSDSAGKVDIVLGCQTQPLRPPR
ncbi:MAG TPA: hypothetical protein VGY54_21000 [Polyangiaceae bacterium]|jgi:hypothetical protein|nr:hypothetical protein [Polyangiaceae bacterium]